jgi:Cu2+-exporting ATPase
MSSAPAVAADDCFHCGLPVPAGAAFAFEADGAWRAFCCAGCEAVARSIAGLGLDDYYRLRERTATRAADGARDLLAWDLAGAQSGFVSDVGAAREAALLLEGMRCAACAWLAEQALARAEGVLAVQVDFSTRRACVRWDPSRTKLSALLAAFARVGYTAWPYEEGRIDQVERREKRDLLRRLAIAALGMMQVMMYAWPAYVAGPGEVTADVMGLMHWAALALTLPVLAYSGAPFLRGAVRDLRHRHLGMDVPVALGLVSAYGASAWNTLAGSGEVYFDSVTMFIFLLLAARYLEMLARSRAAEALRHLSRAAGGQAWLWGGEGASPTRIAIASLRPGDVVLVRTGENVPGDGVLVSERAEVSEAWLSGESRALVRGRGEIVMAGSVNTGDAFVARVERAGDATHLASIQRLVERAGAERPAMVAAAQRASGFFVATVLASAAIAGIAWLAIDPARAPWIAVAVLIVTCPCALALATPAALTAARGTLARRGFVITRARAIEALAGATHVVLDKTGTLTVGAPRLLETCVLAPDGKAPEIVAMAAAIARGSSHPLDRALAEAAAELPLPVATLARAVAGHGLEATVAGRVMRLGRHEFVSALHRRAAPVRWLESEETIVWLGDARGWIAAFRIGDEVRADAAACVATLRARGLEVHLVSGDAWPVAARVARELGIAHVAARMTPERKQEYVARLQAAGARVLVVGDGVNDAPVLAGADVSVAMGGGADLAQLRADAVLLGDSLAGLAHAVGFAHRARRILRQNLGWALGYNLVAIPLAAAGMVTPLVAAIGMSASSLAVVANALRLRR